MAWPGTRCSAPVAHVAPADRIYLVFRSVDGYAAVWIDGVKVGEQLEPPEFMWNRAWGWMLQIK